MTPSIVGCVGWKRPIVVIGLSIVVNHDVIAKHKMTYVHFPQHINIDVAT